MAYTDIITNWTNVANTSLNTAISGAQFDSKTDIANNANLISDSSANALYSKFDESTGTPYFILRAAIDPAFAQNLIINFDVNSGTGLDGKIDFAIVVDVSKLSKTPNGQSLADGVYVTGSDGTNGLDGNTRPNNTDFFIAAGTASEFLVPDSAIAKTTFTKTVGSTTVTDTYVDVILNFNQLKTLLQDNKPDAVDGDEQVVLSPLANFDQNTPIRFALTSSANLNNVNKDISGSDTNDGAVAWTNYLSDPTSISNLQAQDTVPPILQSAAVNGNTLVLTYNELLDATSDPATGAYAVVVNGTAITVSSVDANGSTVTLTLATPVKSGDSVTVSYTKPGTNTVEDASDNPAASFSGQTVTNNTLDTTAPVLQSAAINGNTLFLVYNEALNAGSEPVAGDYTVTVNNVQVAIASVNVDGTTVSITLQNPVAAGSDVKISYTKPGSGPVEDLAGNDANSFTNQTVTNNTGDNTSPLLVTAEIDGNTLVLTYNEALNGGSDPVIGDYAVRVNGDLVTISSVDVNGSKVTLILESPVKPGEEIKISYTPGDQPVEDIAGNNAGALDTNNVANITTDTVPPILQTAEVNGTTLVLTYDEALNGGSDPAAGDFEILVGGQVVTVTGVEANGQTVTLTLGTAVQPNEVVTVSYNPGANPIEDVAGNDASKLDKVGVENKSGDTVAPVLESAEVNGTTLVLTYDEALNGGSDPAAGDFEILVGGQVVTVTGVEANGQTVTLTLGTAVQPNEVVTVSYNPGANPIEDVAGNDASKLDKVGVENKSGDTVAPVLESAEVNGTTLVLTYDEALNGGSDPAAGDFEILVGGQVVTVTGVEANGQTVTLTLGTAVQPNEVVTVSYNPGANPIEDVAGNDASKLDKVGVENKSGDTVAPVLESAEVNGTTLVLTYDEALNGGSDPAAGDFEILVGGQVVTVTGVEANGQTVTLTLGTAVQPNEVVTASYNPGANPIEDVAGNDASKLDKVGVENKSGDTVAPKVTAISSTTPNGTYKAGDVVAITVTFDESVNVQGVPKLTLETGTTDAIATYVDGSGSSTLTFEYTVAEGEESLDLDYIAAGLSLNNGTIKDIAGNDADLSLPAPGEAGSLGANKDIKIDAVNPGAPVVDLDARSDRGSSDTDNITNVTELQFVGTAEANGEVILLIDGEVLGKTTANDSGAWAFTPKSALADGVYNITATTTDAAGNISAASAPLKLEIDTDAPTVGIEPVKTSDASPKLMGTVDDPKAEVSVIVNGITYAATNKGDGTWTLPSGQIAELPAGEYDFTVVATDIAGNETTLDTAVSPVGDDKPLIIDTTAPKAKVRVSIADEEVGSIKLRFNEPVKNLDPSDLKLEVNGEPIDLSGVKLTSDDGVVWKVEGLGDLSTPGTYTLSLKKDNDVTDAADNPLDDTAVGEWTLEHTCEFADALPAIAFAEVGKSLSVKDMDLQNRVIGTPKGNKIVGKKGGDSIIGGKGNDVISGGDGGDLIKGGRDLDQLNGDAGDDLLSGRGGDDALKGFIGNDTLLGGRDTDIGDGGKGNDYMSGRGGKDNLVGMQGHDFIQGGGDSDLLDGGKGSDRIKAGGGKDQLLGQGGNDFLSAGGGNDKLRGGNQHDFLLGKGGNDLIQGDSGDDVLWGGKGKDTIKGGTGRDTVVFRSLKEGKDKLKGFDVTDDLIDVRKIASKTFAGIDLHTEFESLVQRVQVGSDTEIRVDIDGASAGTKFATIATLKGIDATTVTCSSFIVE